MAKLNKIISIVLLLLLYSCSALPRVNPKQQGVDPEFTSYIEEYRTIIGEDKYSHEFENLSFNFADLDGYVVGRCWWLLNGGYEVEIDRSWWHSNHFDYTVKEFVVYHELEHCIRKRMHTDRREEIRNIIDFLEKIAQGIGFIPTKGHLKDGCPASIMHSSVFSSICRSRHYYYYIDEMRNFK